jgi:phosphoglycerol geranylgeranyltransferase
VIFDYLQRLLESKRSGFLVLIDPDRMGSTGSEELAFRASRHGADAILVGTSLALSPRFGATVRLIKEASQVPVILFPGNSGQLAPDADAILFLSLVSGRNADLLIGEQVKAAPLVKAMGLEPIPTGYLLVESGSLTSTQFVSNTLPIPRNKPEIAVAHALAAQYLGMRMIYLEAGSGGAAPVPAVMVEQVKRSVDVPVVVGGGIRRPKEAAELVAAGADFVVVGSALEESPEEERVQAFARAVRGGRTGGEAAAARAAAADAVGTATAQTGRTGGR